MKLSDSDGNAVIWAIYSGNIIPVNGCAVLRVKVETGSSFYAYFGDAGGNYRSVLSIKDSTLSLKDASNTVSVKPGNLHDRWNTIIIKDNGSGYTVWRTTDETKGFAPPLIITTTKNSSTLNGIELTLGGTNSANTFIDYVKLYQEGTVGNAIPNSEFMLVDANGNEITYDTSNEGNERFLKAVLKNSTENETDLMLIAAKYRDGVLVEADEETIALDPGDVYLCDADTENRIQLSRATDAGEYYKIFIFDISNLAPYRNAKTYYEGDRINLLYNNSLCDTSQLDQPPLYIEGGEYLPIEYVAQKAGYAVSDVGDKVVLSKGGDSITLTAGESNATLNGESIVLENGPIVRDEQMLVTIDVLEDIMPIGEDVTDYPEGVALHDEYYNDDATFFNLVTTFTGNPETQRGFSWQAMPEYSNMVIQYSEDSNPANGTQMTASYQEEAVVYNHHVTDPSQKVSYYDTMLFYQISLDDLKPGTTYNYRIGDVAKDVWSEIHTFTTEDPSQTEFSAIAVADTQAKTADDFDYYRQTMDEALEECSNPAFVMHLGDITDNGMCDDWWNMYFEASQSFCSNIPTVSVVGNHETRATGLKYYNLHFMNPQNGVGLAENLVYDYTKVNLHDIAVLEALDNTVYSFDYGDVHFAVLNTGSDWMKSTFVVDLQKEWLKKDIAENGKKWNVVLLHIGIYPAQERTASVSHLYEWMDECDIDLVLQGHDHITMRTKPLNGNVAYLDGSASEVSTANGTVYSILGSAGTKRYTYTNLPTDEWIEVVRETDAHNPSYNVLTFNTNFIQITSKALDGTLLDSYTLTK